MGHTYLEIKATLFEGFIGNLIKNSIQNTEVIYNTRMTCNFLKKGYTQIDLIAVTSKALYVIEAKDWSKYIEGSYNECVWRGLSENPKGMTVYSPFLQNMLHIRLLKSAALRKSFVLPPIINLICVPDSCEIKSNCKEIVHYSEIKNIILSYESLIKEQYNKEKILHFLKEEIE